MDHPPPADAVTVWLEHLKAGDPAAGECGRLLSLLSDGELRRMAIWKLEGHTNAEIAGKLGRSVPTVERKLARVRQAWERETRT